MIIDSRTLVCQHEIPPNGKHFVFLLWSDSSLGRSSWYWLDIENRCFVPSRQDDMCVYVYVCVCAVVRSSIRATIRSTITRVHFTIPRFHDSSRIAVDISVWGGGRIFSSSRSSRIRWTCNDVRRGFEKSTHTFRVSSSSRLVFLFGWLSTAMHPVSHCRN